MPNIEEKEDIHDCDTYDGFKFKYRYNAGDCWIHAS
jgi:hypothetical protein